HLDSLCVIGFFPDPVDLGLAERRSGAFFNHELAAKWIIVLKAGEMGVHVRVTVGRRFESAGRLREELLGGLHRLGVADDTDANLVTEWHLERTGLGEAEAWVGMAMLIPKFEERFVEYLALKLHRTAGLPDYRVPQPWSWACPTHPPGLWSAARFPAAP